MSVTHNLLSILVTYNLYMFFKKKSISGSCKQGRRELVLAAKNTEGKNVQFQGSELGCL